MRQFVYCLLASAVWIAAAVLVTAAEPGGDLQQPSSVLPGRAQQAFVQSNASADQLRRATPVSAPGLVSQPAAAPARGASHAMPVPTRPANFQQGVPVSGEPQPAYAPGIGGGVAPVRYDAPHMPNYAWPSYAPYPNYGAVTYPRQYSPTAWPYIGPFYPYPQVPLGWRKVSLEWDDGWWMLDFKQR
ncbi:MAG: hypothetical protein MI757_12950 [Pirellulales bacterium]|nr:hypothetical protein [Pirellulales bacterium]